MEHKVLSGNSLISEEQLDELSQEGWELIAIVSIEYTFYFYFKRKRGE